MMDNEQLSAIAFSKQSAIFDDIYSDNIIVRYKRECVRTHVEQYLRPQSNILELNSGTGEDAVYFAGQGHRVHATDISEGMQYQLVNKIKHAGLDNLVSSELCSFTELNELKNKGPYDLIFSNFAGLNCTDRLKDVLESFKLLLSEKGLVTLVVLPPFCLWETLMIFRGKLKTAFRRFNSREKGTQAHVEGTYFRCWYYKPSFIVDTLKMDFDLLQIEGLCSIVPPSYIEGFAEKHPRLYTALKGLEDRYKHSWPWKYIGDYYIITLRKK
ncbi:MAG TPA: class I SAM-dependent methyltransferase [Candidatus Babeliaceae bacterium]|nr:class I SAM-dependent methyltransferase [Candidatus Babeliaceae bacterium]